MPKRPFILILAVAIIGALVARVAILVHSHSTRTVAHYRPPAVRDTAAVMRKIAGENPRGLQPWVLDEAAFRVAHPDRTWIVGRSDRPAVSEAEAMDSAHADLARRLFPVFRLSAKVWPGDSQWLQSQLEAQAGAGRLDSETCVECFERPYGRIYAASILADASMDRIGPMVDQVRIGLAARHRRAAIHLMTAGILLLATWAGYALWNSVTRGYVTTRLRWIAALITMGILLLV